MQSSDFDNGSPDHVFRTNLQGLAITIPAPADVAGWVGAVLGSTVYFCLVRHAYSPGVLFLIIYSALGLAVLGTSPDLRRAPDHDGAG